jgi:hypothetical protein
MADIKKASASTEPVTPNVNESVYTATELAENHKVFNTSYEIVAVALRIAGKEAATFTEAKSIIEKFKSKEVK